MEGYMCILKFNEGKIIKKTNGERIWIGISNKQYIRIKRACLLAQTIKNLPAMRENRVPSEKRNGNPLQYSCLENSMDRGPGRLESMGSQRVGHNWMNIKVLCLRSLTFKENNKNCFCCYFIDWQNMRY